MANNNYNYFSNNINRFGEDFLAFKNSSDFKREAPTIFRQIASKRIDLSCYGHFFLDKQFLQSCIDCALEKWRYHGFSAESIQFYTMCCNNNGYIYDPYYDDLLRSHVNTSNAYAEVYKYLKSLQNTQDLNYLFALADKLCTNITLGKSL